MSKTTKTGKLKDMKLERFCREYVANGHNGTKAARAVGKTRQWASVWASDTLKIPNVLARVIELNQDIIDGLIMTKEEIVAEMNKLAAFDPRLAFDEEGHLLPVHEMDATTAAAIKEVEHLPDGTVAKVKFLDNKRAALNDMMKYYNAFEDHQKSGAGEMHVHLDEKDSQA